MTETNWLKTHAEYASKRLDTWPAWKRRFASQFLRPVRLAGGGCQRFVSDLSAQFQRNFSEGEAHEQ